MVNSSPCILLAVRKVSGVGGAFEWMSEVASGATQTVLDDLLT